MLLFRGDAPHAGAKYEDGNVRLFVSISSPNYPLSDLVYFPKIEDDEI